MEEYQIEKIKIKFPIDSAGVRFFNLDISDHYEYMDAKLSNMIKEKFENILEDLL